MHTVVLTSVSSATMPAYPQIERWKLYWHIPGPPHISQHFVLLSWVGNIVPRAGINPTSLAFWASVLPLHHICSLIASQYYLYLWFYYEPQIILLWPFKFMNVYWHKLIVCFCIMCKDAGWIKTNSSHREYGLCSRHGVKKPPIHQPSLYPRLPVYAAPCLRDQCRVLHFLALRGWVWVLGHPAGLKCWLFCCVCNWIALWVTVRRFWSSLWKRSYRGFQIPKLSLTAVARINIMGSSERGMLFCGKGLIGDFHNHKT